MHDAIAAGRLLVATPLLEDPNFRRSVVLLVEHQDGAGSIGVVLNRPSETPVRQVLEPWAGLVTGPSVVFQGGPVERDSALALARISGGGEGGARPPGWRPLDGPPAVALVGLVNLDSAPESVATGVDQFRIFAGYAGWTGGQLRSEIAEGAWYLLPAMPDDAFVEAPEGLWRTVLRRQGGDLAFVATFPEDPSLN